MGKSFEKFAGEGVNDANYDVTKFGPVGPDGERTRLWVCPFYEKWMNLMRRTAKDGCQKVGCYHDVEICEEWKTFSSFKRWMEQQNWEGKVLDKDLKGTGYLYSPENCCFISSDLNTALAGYKAAKLLSLRSIKVNKYSYVVGSERFMNIFDALDALCERKVNQAIACAEHEWEIQAIREYFMKHKLQALEFVQENPDLFPVKTARVPKEKPVKQLTVAALTPIHRQERLGAEFVNKKGYRFKIIEYKDTKNIVVEFETGERKVTRWKYCVTGEVAKP